jgi:hypothetical protein
MKFEPLMVKIRAADPTVADVGAILLTLGTGLSLLGGLGGAPPPPPQPTMAITASRLRPIPNIDVLRRRPRFIDPAPITLEFRFDWVATQQT